MKQIPTDRKYSKISLALKAYFLRNLYYHSMTIKQAASLCHLNYSTAKVVIRDLSPIERKYVRKMSNMSKMGVGRKSVGNYSNECRYRDISEKQYTNREQTESTGCTLGCKGTPVEIISRVAFDFFQLEEANN